ncbi:hypothetical protein NHF40_13730 [Maricaulaceae bacterium EIL42A08]|nr:hypothetical protein [Maricaulaceae bacterium EIL42A08]
MSTTRNVISIGNDKYLDPWLRPASDAMKQIIEYAKHDIERSEDRRRARKPADQAIFNQIVAGVLCAIAKHHLLGLDGWLVTTRSNDRLGSAGRYKSPLASKPYPKILDALAAENAGWIEQRIGVQTRLSGAPATTIRASKRLQIYLEKHEVDVEDIKRAAGGEIIHLKAPKKAGSDGAKLIDYEDTEQTKNWRDRLTQINEFLESAEIIVGDLEHVDPTQVALRRVFNNGRFDHGGRLVGGFWQSMSSKDRFNEIELDGESVVELDYQQMSLSVAYGLAGHPLPAGDLYALDKLESVWNPTIRKRVKQYTNTMLHRSSPMTRRPKDIEPLIVAEGSSEREITASMVREMVLAKHQPIEGWFETGRGMELMFHESEVLFCVAEALMKKSIISLPIFDAILVPGSAASEAEGVMKSVFEQVTGGKARISKETGAS